MILLAMAFTLFVLPCESVKAAAPQDENAVMVSEDEPLVYANFCTGFYLMLDHEWEDAIKFFQKALEINPNAEKVHDLLATCYFKLNKNDLALTHIKKIAQLNPDNFAVHYTLGGIYESEGDETNAINEYKIARKNISIKETIEKVFVSDMLHRLANLYLKVGDFENATGVFHKIIDDSLTNKPVTIYYKLGQIYFEMKRYEDSIQQFLKVRSINPDSESINLYLSLCHEEMKDYDKAISELTPLLEKHSDAWHIRLSLSNIYEKAKNFELMRRERENVCEILQKSVQNGSRILREYIVLSQILQQTGQKKQAIDTLKTALTYLRNEIDKESLQEIQLLMANVYYDLDNHEDSILQLRKILSADPACHQASNFLGYLLVERGEKLDEAITLIEKALESEPENGAYLDSLGWAYYKIATKGSSEKIMMALQTLLAASKHAEDSEIMYHLGEVYYCLGRWEEAKEQWNRALDLLKEHRETLPPYLVHFDTRDSKSMEMIRKKLEKLRHLKMVENISDSQKERESDVECLFQ